MSNTPPWEKGKDHSPLGMLTGKTINADVVLAENGLILSIIQEEPDPEPLTDGVRPTEESHTFICRDNDELHKYLLKAYPRGEHPPVKKGD